MKKSRLKSVLNGADILADHLNIWLDKLKHVFGR